jgi:mannose/cellobiose epimerase-like protein (N-acyl-D-glucosamine 2-epimerase family)
MSALDYVQEGKTVSEPGTEPWRRIESSRLITFGRGAALPGGGFGWLGDDGTVDEARPCPLYVNARMTYVFALAHLQGVAEADVLAASGLDALARHYADRANGGWFSEVTTSGQVTDFTKSNYAHAHVLLAAASAVAAGIAGAEAVLAAATAAIEEHFWSDAEGCALESWNADFTESEPYRGANSNMHSVEAYLVAGDVTGDPAWHARAASIATRLIGQARANSWRIPEHYDERWRPLPEYNLDRPTDQFRPYGTTPGHSFEWARLLLTLEATQSDPPAWLAEAAVALFDAAAADAEGRDGHPGLIYTVAGGGRPVITARLHWVACEAVLAADALHRRTGEERFAAASARWWGEIDRYFLDRKGGGWWQELAPDMTPATSMWPGKPDLYHSYQALLLPSLPLSPTAATALAQRERALRRHVPAGERERRGRDRRRDVDHGDDQAMAVADAEVRVTAARDRRQRDPWQPRRGARHDAGQDELLDDQEPGEADDDRGHSRAQELPDHQAQDAVADDGELNVAERAQQVAEAGPSEPGAGRDAARLGHDVGDEERHDGRERGRQDHERDDGEHLAGQQRDPARLAHQELAQRAEAVLAGRLGGGGAERHHPEQERRAGQAEDQAVGPGQLLQRGQATAAAVGRRVAKDEHNEQGSGGSEAEEGGQQQRPALQLDPLAEV